MEGEGKRGLIVLVLFWWLGTEAMTMLGRGQGGINARPETARENAR